MDKGADSAPFVKQLASGDRATRAQALTLLTTFLTQSRTHPLSYTDLLKIHRALFYTIHHTDRPQPQQRLAHDLTDGLLLKLPHSTFIPYQAAFWHIMIEMYSEIPSLRLDKYLYLVRCHVRVSLQYLERESEGWKKDESQRMKRHRDDETERESGLTGQWCDVMSGRGEWAGKNAGVLDCNDAKVPDGLRYHVLDVWVDGLMQCQDCDTARRHVMGVVEEVTIKGSTKILRNRAKAVLNDERLLGEGEDRKGEDATEVSSDSLGQEDDGDQAFDGFED